MARPSYMREVARRAAAGVPALTPPRTLFRRWGTVASTPEMESAPFTRTTTARPNSLSLNRNFDATVNVRASGDPIGAPDPVKVALSKSAMTEHVAHAVTPRGAAAPAAVQTSERSAPPARSIKPEVQSSSSSFSAPATGVAPDLFRAPQPGIKLPPAQHAARALRERTASSIPAPPPLKVGGDDSAPRTRSDFPSSSPSPLRSPPNHKPAAPDTVAMPIAPRERAPLTALPPPPRSKAPSLPVIRIGSVEVQIMPPVPSAAALIRPAAAASPAAPLSREMISLFGLRQG